MINIGDYVNNKTINYIVKYITKIDTDHKGYKSKIFTSSGIGKQYINNYNSTTNKYNGDKTKEYYTTKEGLKLNLPTYYRNKIFTETEREKLWINKLDKEERWICGEKINISKSEEQYYKTLKFYRKKNKRLGYGDDSKDWSIENYKKTQKKPKKTK